MSEGLAQLLRPASAEPQGALVLLHGRGTDEHDLFPLLDLLDPERKLLGATARGPLSLPPGGAHWYAVRQIGYPDPETFHATYPRLCEWLDGLLAEHGLDHSRLVLGGFSQGTVMGYAVGLGGGRPAPAALLAMSGFMPTVEAFELDLEDRSSLRVAMAHGERDPVIGVEWGRDARERLTAAGAEVLYHEFGGAHHVDPRFMASLPAWIEGSLAHISG